MLVEEFDLLLLALLAGGWARLAWPAGLPPPRPAAVGGAPALWALVVVAFAAAAAVGVWVGLADAGAGDGPAWGWWQGWREPMNVLRTAKPVAWALLAWPLWQALQAREPEAAIHRPAAPAGGHALAAPGHLRMALPGRPPRQQPLCVGGGAAADRPAPPDPPPLQAHRPPAGGRQHAWQGRHNRAVAAWLGVQRLWLHAEEVVLPAWGGRAPLTIRTPAGPDWAPLLQGR